MPDPTPRGDALPTRAELWDLAERLIDGQDGEESIGDFIVLAFEELGLMRENDGSAVTPGRVLAEDHYLGHGTPVPEEAELPSGDARVEGLRRGDVRAAAYEAVAWSVVEVAGGSYRCRECDADVTDVNAPHDPDCVHNALRAALAASEPAAGDGLRDAAQGLLAAAERERLRGLRYVFEDELDALRAALAATPAPVTPTLDARPLTRDEERAIRERHAKCSRPMAWHIDVHRLLATLDAARLAQSTEAAPVDPEAGR